MRFPRQNSHLIHAPRRQSDERCQQHHRQFPAHLPKRSCRHRWRNSKWFMKSVTVFIIPTMTQRCARSICQKNSNDSPHSPLRRSTHAPRNQKESRLSSFIKNDRSVFFVLHTGKRSNKSIPLCFAERNASLPNERQEILAFFVDRRPLNRRINRMTNTARRNRAPCKGRVRLSGAVLPL